MKPVFNTKSLSGVWNKCASVVSQRFCFLCRKSMKAEMCVSWRTVSGRPDSKDSRCVCCALTDGGAADLRCLRNLQKFTTCRLLLGPAHFLSPSSVFLPTLNVCPGSECWKAWNGVQNPLYFRNVIFLMEIGHRARIYVSGSSYPSGNNWMMKKYLYDRLKKKRAWCFLTVYILMKIKKTKIFFFGF